MHMRNHLLLFNYNVFFQGFLLAVMWFRVLTNCSAYAKIVVNLERKNSIFSIPLNGVLKKERPIFDFVLNQVVSALGGGSRP